MSSAEKIIQLLALFTLKRPTWNPVEAAEALGISRASAYRYFGMLNQTGYISEVSRHQYALGPRIVELDRQIRLVDPLVQVAVDAMVNLAEQTGGTALLCRLYGRRVLCIHQERGKLLPGGVSYERGRSMPLFRGATSKVILAYLPIAELEAVVLSTEAETLPQSMPTDPVKLHAHLSAVRSERVCVASGEVDPNRFGVAVPIFQNSRVIGSLSVVLNAAEAKGRLLKTTKKLLLDAEVAIEAELEDD